MDNLPFAIPWHCHKEFTGRHPVIVCACGLHSSSERILVACMPGLNKSLQSACVVLMKAYSLYAWSKRMLRSLNAWSKAKLLVCKNGLNEYL